ncbi:hypothetical protein FGB62_25g227 [Gracilaria domingensis]|nr:hypothetical protein FGB62_25g227 [Gracilaria domingensis]
MLWSMLPALRTAPPQHDLSTSAPVVSIKSAPSATPTLPSFGSISEYPDSPRTPRRVTFTLQRQIYQWLEAMAVTHNYGSVHKSLRDLLEWANTGKDDDMQWLFATPHHIPDALQLNACNRLTDVSCIAGKQACINDDGILLHARLNDGLYQWIVDCVHKYQLCGPSQLLDTLVRCAIQLDAEHDIFDSPECGRDLATTSAELYHDLGIMRYTANDGVQFTRLL